MALRPPTAYRPVVLVTFRKLVEQRVSTWDAVRGKRTKVPGTTMALGRGELPHDLIQLAVEGTLNMDRGFWGSVAAGATFKSTGRRRTKPGRAVIAANRRELMDAEAVVGEHVWRWQHGVAPPAAVHLDALTRAWKSLADRGELTVEWPTLRIVRHPRRSGADEPSGHAGGGDPTFPVDDCLGRPSGPAPRPPTSRPRPRSRKRRRRSPRSRR